MARSYRDKVRKIFADVPAQHKFWLKGGDELNNLDELSKALDEMDDEIFFHHVTEHKNDFAGWVRDVVKDNDLADTLDKLKTKVSTQKAVKLRISSLRNIESIHNEIDKAKESITRNAPDEHEKIKENFEKTLTELTALRVQKPALLKEILTHVGLYIGLLFGFVIGVIIGFQIG